MELCFHGGPGGQRCAVLLRDVDAFVRQRGGAGEQDDGGGQEDERVSVWEQRGGEGEEEGGEGEEEYS